MLHKSGKSGIRKELGGDELESLKSQTLDILKRLLELQAEIYGFFKYRKQEGIIVAYANREGFKEKDLRTQMPTRFFSPLSEERLFHVRCHSSMTLDKEGQVSASIVIDHVSYDILDGKNLLRKGETITVSFSPADFAPVLPQGIGDQPPRDLEHIAGQLYGSRRSIADIRRTRSAQFPDETNDVQILSNLVLGSIETAIRTEINAKDSLSSLPLVDVSTNSSGVDGFMMRLKKSSPALSVYHEPRIIGNLSLPGGQTPSSTYASGSQSLSEFLKNQYGAEDLRKSAEQLEVLFEYNMHLAMLRRMIISMDKSLPLVLNQYLEEVKLLTDFDR